MSYLTRNAIWGLAALVVCQTVGEPVASAWAAEPGAGAEGTGGRQAAVTAALSAVGDPVFGLPVPGGLEVVERTEDYAHFRSPASMSGLIDFYAGELPSHTTERHPDGTKLAGVGDEPTDVYLLPQRDGVDVYYFAPPPELPVVAPARSGTGAQRGRRRTGLELPRATGVFAPPEVVSLLTPDPSAGSALYEARVVEQNGESVTIFVPRSEPREGSGAGARSAPETPSATPEGWHRLPRAAGGGYARGDGERSLRPTAAVGADGEPLPFYGNEHHRGSSRYPY